MPSSNAIASEPCMACGSLMKATGSGAKCQVCRSIHPNVSVDGLSVAYADAWRTPEESAFAVGSTSAEIADSLLEHVGRDLEGARVLDFGAGLGAMSLALRDRGASVTAFEPFGHDPGIEGVAWLRSLSELRGLEPYDFIFLVEVIEHLPSPSDSLATVRALLSNGGRVIITTPNAGGLNARLRGWRWREARNPTHLCLFTMRGLRSCAGRAGFDLVHRDTRFVDFGHRGLRRLLGLALQTVRLDGSLRAQLGVLGLAEDLDE